MWPKKQRKGRESLKKLRVVKDTEKRGLQDEKVSNKKEQILRTQQKAKWLYKKKSDLNDFL